MKKTMINVAVALLLSLGVTACSSKKNETVVSTQPSATAAELAAAQEALAAAQAEAATAKAAAETAQAEADAAKAEAETAQATAESAQADAEAAKAEASTAKEEAEAAKADTAEATAAAETAQAEADAAKAAAETAKAAAETAQAEADAAKAKTEETQAELDEANAALAAIEAQEKTDATRIAGSLSTRYFAGNTTSQTYQYTTDETKKAELLTAIENRSGSCDSKYAATCVRPVNASTAGTIETGDVLYTKNLSYSGYAVVREAYDADNVAYQPVNSYIAVVKTPTTDKSKVGATYTGTATLTQRNLTGLVGDSSGVAQAATLTLNVSDNTISGDVTRNTGKTPATYVTFNETTIKASDSGVVFEGSATFNSQTNALTTQKDADGNWINVSGSYRGAFAGENAEEVVGTFETDSTNKEVSIQGAFSGTKSE